MLQDDKVLSEYDLEGKVLHLVESLQPTGTSSSGENTARSGGVRGSGEAQPPPNNGPLPTPGILLTKTTAAQNEVARSYHKVRGLYFLAVVFATSVVLSYFTFA